MSIIVECAKDGVGNKNTGAIDQCLEGVVIRHALATNDQEFESLEAFKTLATWKAQRDLKKIIPLFTFGELANAYTEDTIYEADKKYTTKLGKKIITFNAHLGFCSHSALKSYNGKKLRVYEFTDQKEIVGVSPDGTKVKGQSVIITVGKRVNAVGDKPPYTPVILEYEDFNELEDNARVAKPTWSQIDFDGIFDVELKLVSASATSIKFTADMGCVGDAVRSFETANITLKTALGVAVTHSFVDADANGVYELTGTGFVNGLVVDLNGVVSQTDYSYESTGALTVSGIA